MGLLGPMDPDFGAPTRLGWVVGQIAERLSTEIAVRSTTQ